MLIVDAPEVLMLPSVGDPLYCRVEAPVNCAFSRPLRFICALLAPLRVISALLTVRFERFRVLAPEITEVRLLAEPAALKVEAPDKSTVTFPDWKLVKSKELAPDMSAANGSVLENPWAVP